MRERAFSDFCIESVTNAKARARNLGFPTLLVSPPGKSARSGSVAVNSRRQAARALALDNLWPKSPEEIHDLRP